MYNELMKLRQRHEDFRVEELTNAQAAGAGDYAFYCLDKQGWTTPDAIARIRQLWKLHYRRISYGGLKDRHAVTRQYLTIYRGPARDLSYRGFSLVYLGQRSSPYTSQDIIANRFRVVIRDVNKLSAAKAEALIPEVAAVGIPNYFDDQRFGSVGVGKDFVARRMVHADWEGALWLALAAPYEFDRAKDKRIKQVLRTYWGQWLYVRDMLPRSHTRSLVCYLCDHPLDYKGAVARLRPELCGLYVAAYQSWLWNRMLTTWLQQQWPADLLIDLRAKHDQLLAPRQLPEHLAEIWHHQHLPLPSARLKVQGDEWWLSLVQQVLHQEGLALEDLRIPSLDRPFFGRGLRAISVRPQQLQCQVEADEFQPGQLKLILSFELPRGSYATLVVKRLMAGVSTSGRSCR
jgi:tRNA pseudouridine13 synthase